MTGEGIPAGKSGGVRQRPEIFAVGPLEHRRDTAAIRIRDDTVALNLYRIAQEAVTNALKHGQATEISISLRRNAGLILTVADDGVDLLTAFEAHADQIERRVIAPCRFVPLVGEEGYGER